MSDIFREVDEDVRRDRYEQLWKQYGNLVVGAVLLLVVAAAAWQVYGHFKLKEAERASAKFQAALEMSQGGKGAQAEALLESIVKKGPAGYAGLARFREAAEIGKRDPAAGAARYDALATNAELGPILQGLAQLRAAMLLADSIPAADLAKRLEPLAATSSPWRNLAREWLGLADLKAGNYDAAGTLFRRDHHGSRSVAELAPACGDLSWPRQGRPLAGEVVSPRPGSSSTKMTRPDPSLYADPAWCEAQYNPRGARAERARYLCALAGQFRKGESGAAARGEYPIWGACERGHGRVPCARCARSLRLLSRRLLARLLEGRFLLPRPGARRRPASRSRCRATRFARK